MPVPLLDVNAQNHPLEAELTEAFLRVFRSGQFIMGPEVEAFERDLEALTGARHALGVSSGTDAILLALMALGIGPGDEVLVPTFTFFATAGCVARVGATPVFVDACPVCFNLDLEDAARKVTPRTKAIIPVHLFGQCADMDGVLALARAHGLKVVEDGAQAIGATYKGRGAGTMGDAGTFSFFPSKNLGGFGDGGAFVCNDDALAEHARVLRVHGAKPKYYHHFVGANFRLDPLQAAMLRVKVPRYTRPTTGGARPTPTPTSPGSVRCRVSCRPTPRIAASPPPARTGWRQRRPGSSCPWPARTTSTSGTSSPCGWSAMGGATPCATISPPAGSAARSTIR